MACTARWRVQVGPDETSARYEPAESATALFVCAHGAGGDMDDRGMTRLAPVLRASGFDLVRFNFLYREQGSRRPDPMPRLKMCIEAVVAHARAELGPARLVIGGRSMGGRAASMLAADGFECEGVLLLAYPLHPAGKPEALRDAHLPRIAQPVLCINGTRDALCRPDLMESVTARLGANFEMHWIDGADHGFHVLKSSGRSDEDVAREIGEVAARWVSKLRAAR